MIFLPFHVYFPVALQAEDAEKVQAVFLICFFLSCCLTSFAHVSCLSSNRVMAKPLRPISLVSRLIF